MLWRNRPASDVSTTHTPPLRIGRPAGRYVISFLLGHLHVCSHPVKQTGHRSGQGGRDDSLLKHEAPPPTSAFTKRLRSKCARCYRACTRRIWIISKRADNVVEFLMKLEWILHMQKSFKWKIIANMSWMNKSWPAGRYVISFLHGH